MPARHERGSVRVSFEPVRGGCCSRRSLPAGKRVSAAKTKGRVIVLGAGKASAAMAAALEEAWDGPLEGLVVTRYGYARPCRSIEILEAAHPVPDPAGVVAARRMLDRVKGLSADDLVIALISGGGSALLPLPAPGLTLADKQAINAALLASGLPIEEMNLIRKHVSAIKGGRLAAAAAPAKVVSLVISDIPGDNPALVASGPTIPDAASREDALGVIERARLVLPEAARRWIGTADSAAPKPDDPVFARNEVHLIASAALSLEAARGVAEAQGITTHILSDAIEGEAREIGRMHAALCPRDCHSQPALRAALPAAFGGRDDRHHGRCGWQGRAQQRIPALFCARYSGPCRCHRACCRYGRDRWQRG